MMHADRTNGFVLTILGLLLTVAGTPVLGAHTPHRHLLDNPVSHYVGEHSAY
jgi:hypothetical protein